MAKTANKRKAPSRIRYERNHPTVSCRVPKTVYDRLQTIKKTDSKSFADVLKVGLGLLEVRAKGEAEIKRQGYAQGYKKGYADAERTYNVTYPCNVCGEILPVEHANVKEAIKQYLQEHNWGHQECHEKSR